MSYAGGCGHRTASDIYGDDDDDPCPSLPSRKTIRRKMGRKKRTVTGDAAAGKGRACGCGAGV
jgi:hypothetical protein